MFQKKKSKPHYIPGTLRSDSKYSKDLIYQIFIGQPGFNRPCKQFYEFYDDAPFEDFDEFWLTLCDLQPFWAVWGLKRCHLLNVYELDDLDPMRAHDSLDPDNDIDEMLCCGEYEDMAAHFKDSASYFNWMTEQLKKDFPTEEVVKRYMERWENYFGWTTEEE